MSDTDYGPAILNAVEEWIGEFLTQNQRNVECGEPPMDVGDRMLRRLRAYRIKFYGRTNSVGCPVCGRLFPNLDGLNSHLHSVHRTVGDIKGAKKVEGTLAPDREDRQ